MLLACVGIFSAIVVIFFAGITLLLRDALDPCVNDGCGVGIKALNFATSGAEVFVFLLAARFALRTRKSLAVKMTALVAAAVAAPVLMGIGAFAAVRLA